MMCFSSTVHSTSPRDRLEEGLASTSAEQGPMLAGSVRSQRVGVSRRKTWGHLETDMKKNLFRRLQSEVEEGVASTSEEQDAMLVRCLRLQRVDVGRRRTWRSTDYLCLFDFSLHVQLSLPGERRECCEVGDTSIPTCSPRRLQSKTQCLREVDARKDWTYADGGHRHEEGVASTSAE